MQMATSLPKLVTSVVAAYKGPQSAVAWAMYLGSKSPIAADRAVTPIIAPGDFPAIHKFRIAGP